MAAKNGHRIFHSIKREINIAAPSCLALTQKTMESIPLNVQEICDSNKSTILVDRSREVSGQQTSQMFSGGFMSSQGAQQDWTAGGDMADQKKDMGDDSMAYTQGYDMAGSANLESVLEVMVPEPYSNAPFEEDMRQIPEGLSETMMERGQRWSMEDRLEITNAYGGASH